MTNLIKFPGKRGMIGRKVKPNDFRYIESKLFFALGKQPFFCSECGGGELDPGDYEDGQVLICPFCKNSRNYGWTYWSGTGIGVNKSIDILINAEVPTVGTMIVLLSEVAKKHGVTINWFTKDGDNIVPIK